MVLGAGASWAATWITKTADIMATHTDWKVNRNEDVPWNRLNPYGRKHITCGERREVALAACVRASMAWGWL
jgi:hypothetical protein